MADPVKSFVQTWVGQNVFHSPYVTDAESMDAEVDRLALSLAADAAVAGLTLDQLENYTGDLSDFLLHEYQNVHDPDHGGARD